MSQGPCEALGTEMQKGREEGRLCLQEGNIQIFFLPSFLIQLLAVFRFKVLILAYAVCRLRHWWAVALTTAVTSAFLLVRVILSKLFSQGAFGYVLPIISFILAWIETWFLDFKVLPQEAEEDNRSPYTDERRSNAAAELRHGKNPESRSQETEVGIPAWTLPDVVLMKKQKKNRIVKSQSCSCENFDETCPISESSLSIHLSVYLSWECEGPQHRGLCPGSRAHLF
ncbi:uncharacterized protein [Notamacropus eugenii]|uniref:uncharacterized protein n=1 Tax=Notamacropus eugenii TaxID=9315 RepID=UPI003B678A23